MNTENKIKELLAKYYEGETTPEEEAMLKKHFTNSDLKSENAETLLFNYVSDQSSNSSLDSDFDEKFLQTIGANDKTELHEQSKKVNLKSKILYFSYNYRYYISAAAVIIVALFISIFYQMNANNGTVITNNNYADNKEKAILETENALKLISSKMNTAETELKKLKYFDKKIENINKYFEINTVRSDKESYRD